MKIKIGSVYNVTFKSGNTHTAFAWPSKIPNSGNRYMKHKVIKITKKLNPKDSLDYDYVGNIYDKIDGAIELKNIKIVSKQLILKSSPFKVAGTRKKSKNRTKKKSKKKTSRKIRRSYKKIRKTKMRGGGVLVEEESNTTQAGPLIPRDSVLPPNQSWELITEGQFQNQYKRVFTNPVNGEEWFINPTHPNYHDPNFIFPFPETLPFNLNNP